MVILNKNTVQPQDVIFPSIFLTPTSFPTRRFSLLINMLKPAERAKSPRRSPACWTLILLFHRLWRTITLKLGYPCPIHHTMAVNGHILLQMRETASQTLGSLM